MRIPIGNRITLLTFSAVASAIIISAVFSIYYFRSNFVRSVESQVAAVGRTLEANIESSLDLGFSLDELAGVNERLGYIASSYKEISGAYITDLSGRIVFHSDPMHVGGVVSYGGDQKTDVTLDDGSKVKTISAADRTAYYEVSIEISKDEVVVGYLKLNIPDTVVMERTLPMAEAFAFLTLIAIVGAVIASFIIGRRIAGPITDLELAAISMARGNFSARAKSVTDDEIGDLSKAFNWMANEIKQTQEKLKNNIVELKNLLELKTEFLHIIDHQLRTPLSVMRGYLDFWRTGQYQKFPQEKQEDIKKKIITATDQLSSIIHSMIDALEVEGGGLEVKAAPFRLGELINEIYEVDFRDKYENKGVVLKADISAAPDIVSDRRYVMAVLTNLLDNALKYTPSGEVVLKAYSDGVSAVIEIADTGIGLSENDMASLFHKFVRGEIASKVSPTGSGIGLYIVKQMLDALNGDIQAYSKGRNQGSLFVVKIPIQYENNQNPVR